MKGKVFAFNLLGVEIFLEIRWNVLNIFLNLSVWLNVQALQRWSVTENLRIIVNMGRGKSELLQLPQKIGVETFSSILKRIFVNPKGIIIDILRIQNSDILPLTLEKIEHYLVNYPLIFFHSPTRIVILSIDLTSSTPNTIPSENLGSERFS
jgi:hypothetical protein